MRKLFMYLGTGKHMSLDWFLPLHANLEVAEGSVTGSGMTGDGVAEYGDTVDVVGVPALYGLGTSSNENNQEHLNNTAIEVDPTAVHRKLDDVLNQLRSKLEANI